MSSPLREGPETMVVSGTGYRIVCAPNQVENLKYGYYYNSKIIESEPVSREPKTYRHHPINTTKCPRNPYPCL